MADGTVKIQTKIDQSGFNGGMSNIQKTSRKTFEQMAQESGKSIDEIKQQVKELAESYQREGMNIPNSYRKAYAELGLQAQKATQEIKQEAEKIADAYEEVADTVKSTVGSDLENAFDGAIDRSTEFADGIEDVARSTENAAESLEKATDKTNKFSDSFKSGLSKLSGLAKTGLAATGTAITAVAGAATAATGALLGVAEATEEYRIAQGKLNTAFQSQGFSLETAKEAYTDFYAILGDVDTAIEASQLLSKLAMSQEDVSKWTNIAAGVWGEFGDSIPIESLIEASNEVSKSGQLTGVLVDALVWAGIQEEEFQGQLDACSTEAERNQLIMQTLSDIYSESAAIFHENNTVLEEARQAQVKMMDALSGLGAVVQSVQTQLTADFLPSLVAIVNAFTALLQGADGASEQLADAIGQLVTKASEKLPEFLTFGGNIITALIQGIIQALPTLIDAGMNMLVQLLLGLQQNQGQIVQTATTLVTTLADGIMQALPWIIQIGVELIAIFIQTIINSAPQVLQSGQYLLSYLADGVELGLPFLAEKIPQIITSFLLWLTENSESILQGGVTIITQLANGIINSIPILIEQLPTLIDAFINFIIAAAPQIIDAGFTIVENLAQGIVDNIPSLVARLPELIGAIVQGIIALNIQIFEVGRYLTQRIAEGIVSILSMVTQSAYQVGQSVADKVGKFASKMFEIGANIVTFFVNGIKSLISNVAEATVSINDTIANTLRNLPSIAFDIGKNIVQNIWQGIQNLTGWLGSKISGFASSLIPSGSSSGGSGKSGRSVQAQAFALAPEMPTFTAQLAENMPSIQSAMAASVQGYTPSSVVAAPKQDIGQAMSKAVGAISLMQNNNQSREIVLNLNGTEIARGLINDIRAVESQSPAIIYS